MGGKTQWKVSEIFFCYSTASLSYSGKTGGAGGPGDQDVWQLQHCSRGKVLSQTFTAEPPNCDLSPTPPCSVNLCLLWLCWALCWQQRPSLAAGTRDKELPSHPAEHSKGQEMLLMGFRGTVNFTVNFTLQFSLIKSTNPQQKAPLCPVLLVQSKWHYGCC